MPKNNLEQIISKIASLSPSQLEWIRIVTDQFSKPAQFQRSRSSDIITESALGDFGDALRIHHCFSKEAFTKDKFEYTLERVLNLCGIPSELASRGNRGHDITIGHQKVSLKTQADKNIHSDFLHISKFMELGKGKWVEEADLDGLREQFLGHLQNYDRIFSLRGLKTESQDLWHYELIEIPISVLLKASSGKLEMVSVSKQSPKPGYCHVVDRNGDLLFQLYFDGGSERKLQIKKLSKKLCILHAEWRFTTEADQS